MIQSKCCAIPDFSRRYSLDILIEELDGSIWVAAVKDGRIEGLEVDPVREEVRWGSVFWAKVARIDKALDAAFVNLDGNNIGILYNADVCIRDKKTGRYKMGGDVAIGKVLEPGQMVAVQAKSGYLPKSDETHARAEDKNPRLSMNIVLPGRYILYAPMEGENRISRRIVDKKLRKQLMTMLEKISGEYKGCILRSAAAGTQTDILIREAKILKMTWDKLQEYFKGDDPTLIMLGPDAVQRMLGDQANQNVERIDLTTMDHYQAVEEWCEIYAPDLVVRIQPVELPDQNADLGLFAMRDILNQIEGLFHPYVVLPGGGTLIIEQTAALTAIDVNSGADKRAPSAINLEAAREIARQIRLRNLGGMILIDFLKLKDEAARKQLQKELGGLFEEKDSCTVQIHGFTRLGLLEVTRSRRTPPLQERFESVFSE